MFKAEMKKSLKNIFFIATVIVASAIAVYAAVTSIGIYNKDVEANAEIAARFAEDVYNPDYPMLSLFNHWMAEEWNSSGQALFYLLFPFFASLAFSWSICSEIKSGYIRHMATRANRTKYFISKYFAVFISGGLAVTLPMLINFMAVSSFVPAYKPDIYYDIYYAASNQTVAFSSLFFSHPYVFVIYRFLSTFIYSGLFAVSGAAFSLFVKSRIVACVFPLLLSLGLTYVSSYHFLPVNFSPSNFLHGGGSSYGSPWYLIVGEAAIMFLITFSAFLIKSKKDDIF